MKQFQDPAARVQALAALAPYLSEAERVASLGEALEVAKTVTDSYERAEIIAKLASSLPDSLLSEALAVARVMGESPYLDMSPRAEALEALAPRLAILPSATLHELWRKTLRILATRSRQEFLWDLPALSPVIIALGGTQGITESIHAIGEVAQWWP